MVQDSREEPWLVVVEILMAVFLIVRALSWGWGYSRNQRWEQIEQGGFQLLPVVGHLLSVWLS